MRYLRLLDLSARVFRCLFFALAIFSCLGLSLMLRNHLALAQDQALHSFLPARYDILLVCCVALQYLMLRLKWESMSELGVISLFHAMGLCMEIFKVHHHSWSYPEEAWTKLYGVPLYSGFMYASVASFFCQAWKCFEVEVRNWPLARTAWILASALYLNFFTQHYTVDVRWPLLLCVLYCFRHARFGFRWRSRHEVSLLLFFLIMGCCIWCAENIATFLGAWQYTYQHSSWRVVSTHKILSWTLMSIVSIIIVVELKFIQSWMRRYRTLPPSPHPHSLARRSEFIEHSFIDLL